MIVVRIARNGNGQSTPVSRREANRERCPAEPFRSRPEFGLRPQLGRFKMPRLMKHTGKFLLLAVAATVLSTTGCVQTMYTKSVTVKRDADGKIIETSQTETVSQPGVQNHYIQFENLKASSSDPKPINPK